MASRVSLKDVASAAQVSVSTASLALSGDHRVAPATRERILAAAKQLGYVRDPILASIAAGHFRHTGKPISVGLSLDARHWIASLQRQGEAMGMTVRPVNGALDEVCANAVDAGCAALVIYRRGVDGTTFAGAPLPVVLWEDEGPADPPVDLVETCEWWTATIGAVARVRAAGFERPAVVLFTATPPHWHDHVRLAAARSLGIPVLQWDHVDATLAAFLREHEPDAVVGFLPGIDEAMQRLGRRLPFACLLLVDDPWFAGFTGWMPDNQHREQVTLELIEQRLRYGPRPPRRIQVPPRWREAGSLSRQR